MVDLEAGTKLTLHYGRAWEDVIIPLSVELVPSKRERGDLLIGNFNARGVLVSIKFCPHLETGPRGDGSDQLDNDLVTGERSPAPVHADVREQPVPDLVPLAGAGGQMTDCHPESRLVREAL